jgi:hypothetical protein
MEDLLLVMPLFLGKNQKEKNFLHIASTVNPKVWNAFYGTVDGKVYNNFATTGETPLEALIKLQEVVHLLELF